MQRAPLVIAGALASVIGCTSLLGDFEVRPEASSDSSDGAVQDTSSADATTDAIRDASEDTFDAQSTVFTQCGISSTRLIEQIDDATVGFEGGLKAFRSGDNVRVVVRKKNSAGAFIYSFNPKSGGQASPITAVKIDLGGGGRHLDTRRLANQGILALLFLEPELGAPVARVVVYELPDTDLAATKKFRASSDFQVPPETSNLSGALGGYAASNEYFWALSTASGTSLGQYDLLVGHRTNVAPQPKPVIVYTGEDRTVRIRDIARSQTTVYVFNDRGPEGPADPGSSYFPVPENIASGPISPRSLQPQGSTKPFVVLGVSGVQSGDGIRAAFAEIDFSGAGGGPGQLRIGEVPGAVLPTLDGTKVPPAFSLGSLLEAPLGGMEARFFGDDFLWIGTPPDPQRGQGLNFLWYNSTNRIMRNRQVGAQRLLALHPNILGASVVVVAQTSFSAELDLLYTEEVAGKSFLAYATMNCVR